MGIISVTQYRVWWGLIKVYSIRCSVESLTHNMSTVNWGSVIIFLSTGFSWVFSEQVRTTWNYISCSLRGTREVFHSNEIYKYPLVSIIFTLIVKRQMLTFPWEYDEQYLSSGYERNDIYPPLCKWNVRYVLWSMWLFQRSCMDVSIAP